MSRFPRPLLAIAIFALASFARADAPRLVAPAVGSTLRGGSFAELRWSAAELPKSAEEWEAFLSVDGGKYYAFRITPHLDLDRRRFSFIVPNVDTHDARILIRTGNEVNESHFEIPGSFSIVRDANAGQVLPRVLQIGRGEAARDGDPAVLSWTDGERNGSGITLQTSPTVPPTSLGARATVTASAPIVLVPAASPIAAPSITTTLLTARRTHARNAEPIPIPVDLLLVCSRWNI
jgi:hypothetical protein